MCDIGWAGWIFVVVYFLFIAAVAWGILFGVGYAISTLVKKRSESSKLP
jgi:hypothetical protein